MPKAGTLENRPHRNPILTPRSRHPPGKSQEGRFRKRPKERKPFLHQPTLLAPTFKRQPLTPIQPQQILRHQIPSPPRSNSRDLKSLSPSGPPRKVPDSRPTPTKSATRC